MSNQSPAQRCKARGFTLQHVSDVTGVSRNTLENWSRDRSQLFDVILDGVAVGDLSELALTCARVLDDGPLA